MSSKPSPSRPVTRKTEGRTVRLSRLPSSTTGTFVNKFGKPLREKLHPDEVLNGVHTSDLIVERCFRATRVPRTDCARIFQQVFDEIAYDMEQAAKTLDRTKAHTKRQITLPGYLGYLVMKVSNPGKPNLTITLDPSWRLIFIVNAIRLRLAWPGMSRHMTWRQQDKIGAAKRPFRTIGKA